MSRYPWQFVELYVTSSVLDEGQLKRALDGSHPDEIHTAQSGVCSALFKTRLPPTDPVWNHLEDLLGRAKEVFAVVSSIDPTLISCGVSITQRASPTDETGPGLHIDSEWIRTLARVDGEIDIDLYVDYPED